VRTCRFRVRGRASYGIVEGQEIRALSSPPWAGGLPEGPVLRLSEVTLLAPVEPSKVVCVGRNYGAHAREMGVEVPREPLFFMKPSTAVIGPMEEIRLPEASREVNYEAELACVIGKALTRVTPAEARAGIFGYTCLDDVTARDVQRAQQHYTRAKGYDTFCPIGPVVDTAVDPLDATVSCRVNGEPRQRGSTRDLIFDPFAAVSFISQVMTLLPGDVVSTGTPDGVGPLRRGDWVEVEVSGVGVLKNPVV
jgi:2-keto-4-pentenoate hydratase/2-oxohepta-3-ene-1,7-dioic acid hydratase in catechol pathway